MSPEPIHISDWQIAEQNAARWMKFWGYTDARVTGGGADGGVDVISSRAVAQVKFKASQAGGPELQRLAGAGYTHPGVALMFFTGTGYSAQALQVAGAAHIALFTYRLDGAVTPVNSYAKKIANTPTATRKSEVYERPQGSVSPLLGVYFLVSLIVGLFCFFYGLSSQDGASGARAFLSFVLLLAGLVLLFLAWVLWGALVKSAGRSDS